MDVDPPFFQRESDSSNEDNPKLDPRFLLNNSVPAMPRNSPNDSSAADDYRSVIDDLTIEIQRLKEELKRYKQLTPDKLNRERLFEVKIHGLPKRKKRELEDTLREFAATLDRTPSLEEGSSQKKQSRRQNRMYSASGSHSKYQASSSGSRSRPVDSAYASASTGAHSSGTSLARPSVSSKHSSDQKVQRYLNDIPEGLYPRHMVMSDKEKKKMVVRRLEHLFTGKFGNGVKSLNKSTKQFVAPPPVVADGKDGAAPMVHQPPMLSGAVQASREAKMLTPDDSKKQTRSRDNVSTSHSGGEQTESAGNGNSSGGGNATGSNTSPPNAELHEQRPTRPRDLDPDRVQVPSENMEYIRHLGLVPPELLGQPENTHDVSPDAEGWVYLNLLCNLAQLHIINVAPDFIRAAVAEKSSKLQLSPDGRKVRWRGGSDGSKFSSDSSAEHSQRSPTTDESESVKKDCARKKQKTQHSSAGNGTSGGPSLGRHNSGGNSTHSFHYQPLFARKSPSQVVSDESGSSYGGPDDSNIGESRWDNSGSGSTRRKRRRDGAIIYYSGAPFCTDLSGDPGDVSPVTYVSSMRPGQESVSANDRSNAVAVERSRSGRPTSYRGTSNSSLAYRPLSDPARIPPEDAGGSSQGYSPPPLLTHSSEDSVESLEFDAPWSEDPQVTREYRLEPCGIGGVLPEDHFVVVVTSRRPKSEGIAVTAPAMRRRRSRQTADSLLSRIAALTTTASGNPPEPSPSKAGSSPVSIEYLSGRIKRLEPVPLPPPATFYPPFSSSSSSDFDDQGSDGDDSSSEEYMGRLANPHQSDNEYLERADITGSDEEGGEPDGEESPDNMAVEDEDDDEETGLGARRLPPLLRREARRRSSSADGPLGATTTNSDHTRSSLATAGGAKSHYSSSSD
jgi:hypothetical protein